MAAATRSTGEFFICGNFGRFCTLKLVARDDRMVQYAVTLKDGDWTVFKDGEAIERGLTRSAAIQMAKDLAFDAEEKGDTVELLIQGYYGDMSRRLTGGVEED
jgi:hypothetical protein